ncbi:MAG: hypothetical protein E7167_05025 [Firmicutes bacterium]|nr:hypothetical protein [Bacillota bacterium]
MKIKIKNYLLALCSALTLVINWQDIYFEGLKTILDYKLILVFLLSLIIGYVYNRFKENKTKYSKILAFIFCLFMLIGNSYINFGTIEGLYRLDMLPWTIIKAIGFYTILEFIINFIQNNIGKLQCQSEVKENKFIKIFNKYPLLTCMSVLALSWLLYYIAFYPIILSPDPSFQIKQFLGERTKYLDYSIQLDESVTITNHHPVFHTLLIGGFTKLGMLIGNDNFGLFLYSLIQGIFMAFTLSKTICLLKEKKIKNRYLLLILAIYALVPMFPLYAINGNKDVYYSMFVLWLFMIIFKYLDTKKDIKLSFIDLLTWFFVLMFICLFRNNGIYLIIILFPCVLFYKKVNIKKMASVFILVISLFYSYQKILLPALGITEGSVRETLSIFFQQTARYVINHEEDLTNEEKNIIGTIINYDNIKSGYDPEISDPIKNTFNKYATKEDLKEYFNIWFKGLLTHPMTYIDATLNNTYGYFDPEGNNWYIYANYDTRITNLVDYHFNDLNTLRSNLKSYANMFRYIPIIGLISNIGFSSWIVIAMGVWLLFNKKIEYLILLVPAYVSILVCIASPVNTYFRYAMPYVFAIPFIVGTWFYINKKRISR